MKKKLPTVFLILVFFVGLSLLLYPSISDYINALHQSSAVAQYNNEVTKLDQDIYAKVWANAQDYNQRIGKQGVNYQLSDRELAAYKEQLNVSGSGVIAYIAIPSISCELPIYHGTNQATLQTGIGHIEWSSLPVGGAGTHCILSGHRGLPSSRLFTDLGRLTAGDIFKIFVLDQTLTYEVDQILIVEPEDTKDLQPVEGMDYCTLVTCTPYGINSHRLLVRGVRIENPEKVLTARVSADAVQIEPILIAPMIAVPILMILLACLIIKGVKRN